MSDVLPIFVYDVVAYRYTLTLRPTGREVLASAPTAEEAMTAARDNIYELAGDNFTLNTIFQSKASPLALQQVRVEPRLVEAVRRKFI